MTEGSSGQSAGLPGGIRPCRTDPRFGFVLVGPPQGRCDGLVVAIHDSTRDLEPFVDSFAPWARAQGLALLVPHFPADVRGDGYADGYKFLHEADIRYDVLLHDMVREAAASLGCPSSDFYLHGYSGGAQFAHRYLLLHPQRVRAASIGAPGEVTLLDEALDWWAGIRDAKALFGMAVQPATMRRTPIQLLVGERDTDTSELVEQPPSRFWRSDEERVGANRIDRLRTLHDCLCACGAGPRLELMPGLAHGDGAEEAMRRAQRFFEQARQAAA
jgi:pimeloyl-ACP methyl ester carboxylesterase